MEDHNRKVTYREGVYRKGMTRDLDEATRALVVSIIEGWVGEGESKADIARSLGVTKPTVQAVLERGEAGLKVARAVATRVGISLDELERRAAAEAKERAPEEGSQLAPPPSGLMRHRDYPPLRERLLEHFAPKVVEMTDRADFGQAPEFLTWEFVRGLAEAAQKYLIEKAERERQSKKGET